MGKKKKDEISISSRTRQGTKVSTNDGKKPSVSAILASMDQKPDNPRKGSSSLSGSTANKHKAKVAPEPSYTDGIDLPPSDDEEDRYGSESDEETAKRLIRQQRAEQKGLDIGISAKELKKRAEKERSAAHSVERAKQEALKDDRDAFIVAIGSRDSSGGADANVKDITIDNFSVSARGKELLKDASLKISHGRRYGLVGPNGKGKSTLLKLLAWRKIPFPKNIDVLLVEQEVIGDDKSALEAVVSANEELVKIRQEVASLHGDDDDVDDTGKKLTELYGKMQILGSDAAEAQASKILAGLGFTKDMQVRATRSSSGGWRMRISLARALFVQPTLLLLDEPTNHLDLRAVLWLEEYLRRWKKTLVVVSHDRDFLNAVCTEIIHLDEQKLHLYRGDFDKFAAPKKVKGRAKFAAPKKLIDYSVVFHFPDPTKFSQSPHLLQLKDVSFSYPDREDFRLSEVDLDIDMGTRVAIVGPNGAGKSTLLKLLAGDLVPSEGESLRDPRLRIGRYSQHFVGLLAMNETPVEYLLRLHHEKEGLSKPEAVRAKLGKFGLKGHHHVTPIVKLSGGQKARVVFTSISMSNPHILLLDEPTNHLDMESIDALGDALDKFKGGVVLVSHDARLISRVCKDEEKSMIWAVEDGTVKKFPGTFEEYKEELLREIKAEVDD